MSHIYVERRERKVLQAILSPLCLKVCTGLSGLKKITRTHRPKVPSVFTGFYFKINMYFISCALVFLVVFLSTLVVNKDFDYYSLSFNCLYCFYCDFYC